MTNITKAAKQALEALESLVHNKPYDGRYSDAIIHLRAALQDKAGEVREPVAYRVDYPGVDSIGLRRFFGADQWAASKGTVEFLGGVAVPLYAQPAPVVPDDVARYRTIRNGLVYIEPYESGEIYVAGETGVYTKSGDEFDAAIDAIAASQKKGGQHG